MFVPTSMKLPFLFLFSLLASFVWAQSATVENVLAETGRKILVHPEYEERKAANQKFLETLEEYIATEEGYNAPLTSVTNMLRLTADDEVRIYTWQMPDSTYEYVRFGLVAAQTRKGIVVTRLNDATADISQPEFKILKPENWYGAIYYSIIPIEKRRNKLYTLLGFAPGADINRKIVEVMELDNRGRPKFGAKIFKIDQFMDQTLRKPPMRLILSYGGKYAASVRWNEEKEMIVMDHLSPPDEKLKGVYRMYGPDMSYDGLVWDDDWWNLKTQVKFNTGQDVKIVPPDKPSDLPAGRPSSGTPPPERN